MALDMSPIQATPPYIPGEIAHHVPMPAVDQAAVLADAPKPVVPSELQKTIQEMQKVSAAFNRRLSFSVNEKLDSIVVKVVDSDTDKVIREIPPAELQHVYEAIRDTIGLLFDHKA
ncbi:MAG: flagellar protein FlaG [Rectinemataceae bacterium]